MFFFTCTTITEESIMPDELHVMSLMADLDAVDADRVPIRRIARVAAVEVVHRERCVRGDFVQALTAAHRLLHLVVIVEDLVGTANDRLDAARQTQAAKLIVKDLIVLECRRSVVGDFHAGRQSIEDSIAPKYGMRLG